MILLQELACFQKKNIVTLLDACDDVEYYEWAKVDGKVKKIIKSVDAEEVIELFNEQVKILKVYIFVKRTQNTHYNRLKENLKTNEFIIHVDYSENYKDKEQDEIQSAYFGHNSFSYLQRVATHAGLMVHS